jgi:crossover junction endodeoxyribonuclease RusA
MWNLPLSYTRPPLTQNQRLHWTHRARVSRQIHDEIGWQARAQHLPKLDRPTVTLHYLPKDRRRRDVDNLVPTSKACLDGLVAAGLLTDDSSTDVDHRMPVIHPAGNAQCRLWLEVAQ